MYYTREVADRIKKIQTGFPVISVTGPRQSGKTTFLQHNFPDYRYFNLENPQTRALIASDFQQFFQTNPRNVIIDEVQRLPELLSYLQTHVDRQKEMGAFVISGSQNLLLSEQISQSLAGRAGYQTILPFSTQELKAHKLADKDRYTQILKGFYPALYTRSVEPGLYYNQYIATYVERDVRLIRNIQDLSQFQKFVALLAGRVGQIVNVSALAGDAGISPHTAEDWLSVLEASYIIFRLPPFHKNFGKRLVKSPKIFFFDTGLLCALLNISSISELTNHFAIGGIFENFVIAEFVKEISVKGLSAKLYFYRDSRGKEVDLLIDGGAELIPVEIKSSATFNTSFLQGLENWRKQTKKETGGFVVYGGTETQILKKDSLVGWNNLEAIFKTIK